MEDQNAPGRIEEVLDVDCPSCGSKLFYSADHQQITCHHCGYKEDYERNNDRIIEIPLSDKLDGLKLYEPESSDKKVYDCKSCSAKFMVDADKTRIVCAFCGSENVNVEAFAHRFIQPAGIIPFYIPRSEAEKQFKIWIKRGWFHPNKLKVLARIDGLHGVYIPFWTYDANTSSDWEGEAGTYYYETVRVKVGNQWQTKQVQKVRWKWRSGHLDYFFNDIVVSSSGNLTQSFLERILPYKMEDTVNFDPRLMVGWESEVYSVELDEGYVTAEGIIDKYIRAMCAQALGGDTQRNLRISTEKYDQTFKHIVMPVWLASYKYQGKIFRFVVNGQTGKVYGKKPISWWKVAFAVFMFVLFILAVVWLAESGVLATD